VGVIVNVEDVGILYAYDRWANHRVIEAVRPLDHERFTRELGTSHGSIQGTLVHTMWSEWIWLQRWGGDSPKRVFAPDEFPDVGSIEAYWRNLERAQQEFITRLTNERLEERISYVNLQDEHWTYSLAHMMQHVVNHSSYHRGQVITLLRQVGRTPPSTDFLLYFDETGARG
jgi:uncharacterized damage-inducible protein DinB